jgi:putative lipoic acid-binding regulatory protein
VTDPRARFEDLVEFPSVFAFRAVGAAEADYADRCVRRVEDLLARPVQGTEVRPSSKGRWLSVRIAVQVESADEIRSVYTALHEVTGTRMVL